MTFTDGHLSLIYTTHVAFKFEHLAMAVVAGHLIGRLRLATPTTSTTHHMSPPGGASRHFGGIAGTARVCLCMHTLITTSFATRKLLIGQS